VGEIHSLIGKGLDSRSKGGNASCPPSSGGRELEGGGLILTIAAAAPRYFTVPGVDAGITPQFFLHKYTRQLLLHSNGLVAYQSGPTSFTAFSAAFCALSLVEKLYVYTLVVLIFIQ